MSKQLTQTRPSTFIIINGEKIQLPTPHLTTTDNLLHIMVRQLDENRQLLESLVNRLDSDLKVSMEPEIIRFPKDQRWEWLPVRKPLETVPANEAHYPLIKLDAPGWLYGFVLIATDPNLRIALDIKATEPVDVDYSIAELYARGGDKSKGHIITKYDAVNNVYAIEVPPGSTSYLGIPFRDVNEAWLNNPTAAPIIFTFEGYFILVK